MNRWDVIVVGGGLAGLSAATAVAAAGRRVLVLEARATLGGRASTFTDPVTAERVDNGQHVLFGCYHRTFDFLDRIGARSAIALDPRLRVDIVDRSGRPSRLTTLPLPAPYHLLGGLLRWRALTWRDRLAALRLGRMLRATHPGRDGDAETVRAWLLRRGQTPRLIELLWEPLAVAALNQSIDVAAAAPFVRVLTQMLGRDRRNAAMGLPLKPLDELYARPATDFLGRHGGAVRTGTLATITSDMALRSQRVSAGDETFEAPAVICAVAWHALAQTFPQPSACLQPLLDHAAATLASPIVTVNLWFDRAVAAQGVTGLPGRAMQWVFDKRVLLGEDASHLSAVSSGAAALVGRSNDELIELALSEISDALPPARAATLRRALVVREKRATFSLAPGQPPRPATRTGVPGLYLAGDWIDTGLPATIEGAVLSGEWAAAAAVVDT